MNNDGIMIPYYSGNIRFTKCIGHCSLEYFIKAHKNPNQRTMKVLGAIKQAESNNDEALKRKLKHKLFSFTPSVFIKKGYKRNYESISFYTGLMQLDFDKLRDKLEAIDLRNHIFKNYKHIVTAYRSPSGKGVKCLIRIKKPRDKKHYKALYKALLLEFEQYDSFDKATTNAMLPLFLSHDPDILHREYEDCLEWDEENWDEPEYIELNNEPPPNFNSTHRSSESEYEKTIRIFRSKIDNIVGNGHTQVRSASLIIGSRVGANYISKIDAMHLASDLIGCNNYLSKDVDNYKKTANWGIEEGFNNPKYYK